MTPEFSPIRKALGRPDSQALLGAVVLLGVASIFTGNPFVIGLFITGLLLYILAASMNLLLGYSGLFSLGHQGIYAIGAYVSAYFGIKYLHLPWIVTVLVAIVLGALVSGALALPTARLRGEYLALATLAFGIAAQQLLIQWQPVTGGSAGLVGVPQPSFFGPQLVPDTFSFLVLVVIAAALTYILIGYMLESRLGRSLHSLRDSPLGSRTVGIDPTRVRVLAFTVSGALASLAGALYASYILFIDPSQFSLSLIIEVIAAVLIGGSGTLVGPLVGAAVITVLQAVSSSNSQLGPVIYASVLLITLLVFRGGIVGTVSALRRRLKPPMVLPESSSRIAVVERPGDGSGLNTSPAQTSLDSEYSLSGIDVQFGGVYALSNAGIVLRPGHVVGLIGPNGAGKTTLVNVATGIVRASTGEITLDGTRLKRPSTHLMGRAGITRTFQHPQLSPDLSIVQNVMLGLDRTASASLIEAVVHAPRSRADERLFREKSDEYLERLGIESFGHALAGSVPHGVQRRAELARVLVGEPRYVFLDEVGAGLNDDEKQQIVEIVQSFGPKGPGFVIIEHNMEFVRKLCERVTVLVGGKVLVEEDTHVALSDERVVDAYLGRRTTITDEKGALS